MTTEKLSFEKSLEKLEKIVSILEEGNLSLDDAIQQYEEGIELSKVCYNRLQDAEKKVETLHKKADGSFKTEPFHDTSLEEESSGKKKKAKRSKPIETSEGTEELFS